MECWVEKIEMFAKGTDVQDLYVSFVGKNCFPIENPKVKPLEICQQGLKSQERHSQRLVEQDSFQSYSKPAKPKIIIPEKLAQSWQQKIQKKSERQKSNNKRINL